LQNRFIRKLLNLLELYILGLLCATLCACVRCCTLLCTTLSLLLRLLCCIQIL
jgi:hypothetical protein